MEARVRNALRNFRLQHPTGIRITLMCSYGVMFVTGIIVMIATAPPIGTGFVIANILKGVVIVFTIPLLTVAVGFRIARQLALDEHDHKQAEGAGSIARSTLLLAFGLLAAYGLFCLFAF